MLLAGLLYLGSGVGLGIIRLLRDRGLSIPAMPGRDWCWMLGAIAFGGVIAPVLLMYGLTHSSASSASLLLNLEAVLTAVLAWIVFHEHTDRRNVIGMALIVVGGAVLAWPRGVGSGVSATGVLLITGACLCWAIDNNLTRKVSGTDALFVAGAKGLIAGATNVVLALVIGARLPAPIVIGGAMAVGLLGYGASLVLFVVGLRELGSARTGAYFSTAPFLGAAIAIVAFHEPPSTAFWITALLMALGVALHLMERHEHDHTHEALAHEHAHTHDVHHQHAHAFVWNGEEPHSHEHNHEPLLHRHPHYPDLHHRHGHAH
jgi:drug/metabolite transporter (DMT)-like permease